jgi:hypothetical protein
MNLGMKKAFGKFGGQKKQHDSDEEFDATLSNITNDLEQSPGHSSEKSTSTSASTIFRMKAKLGSLSKKGSKKTNSALEDEPIESVAATAELSHNKTDMLLDIDSFEASAVVSHAPNFDKLMDDDPEKWEHEESLTPGAVRRRVSEVLEFESGLEYDDCDDVTSSPVVHNHKSASVSTLPMVTEETHSDTRRPKSMSVVSHQKLSKYTIFKHIL